MYVRVRVYVSFFGLRFRESLTTDSDGRRYTENYDALRAYQRREHNEKLTLLLYRCNRCLLQLIETQGGVFSTRPPIPPAPSITLPSVKQNKHRHVNAEAARTPCGVTTQNTPRTNNGFPIRSTNAGTDQGKRHSSQVSTCATKKIDNKPMLGT